MAVKCVFCDALHADLELAVLHASYFHGWGRDRPGYSAPPSMHQAASDFRAGAEWALRNRKALRKIRTPGPEPEDP